MPDEPHLGPHSHPLPVVLELHLSSDPGSSYFLAVVLSETVSLLQLLKDDAVRNFCCSPDLLLLSS